MELKFLVLMMEILQEGLFPLTEFFPAPPRHMLDVFLTSQGRDVGGCVLDVRTFVSCCPKFFSLLESGTRHFTGCSLGGYKAA